MKKAQGQIITTILIILLILAAIVIVWQVVNRTVQKGADEISTQTDFIGITLEIESAYADGNIAIRRGTGGPPEAIQVYSIVEGQSINEEGGSIDELGVSVFALGNGDVGDEVKAGAILAEGTLCAPIASKKVIA